MKRATITALGFAVATAFGGALALPAYAHGGNEGNAAQGAGNGSGMQQQMGSGMMGGTGMSGGGMGLFGNLADKFDTNGDGRISVEEMRAGLTEALKKYDTDGNGTLSLNEFAVFYNDAMREKMVDRFQAFDNDGNGQVTAQEITAPAKWLEKMEKRKAAAHDQSNSAKMKAGPAKNDNGAMMNDNGSMMNGNN